MRNLSILVAITRETHVRVDKAPNIERKTCISSSSIIASYTLIFIYQPVLTDTRTRRLFRAEEIPHECTMNGQPASGQSITAVLYTAHQYLQ